MPKRSRIVLPVAEYKELCMEVMKRDNWKCRVCSRRSALHCHHIKFRSHGGDDAKWNLITLCDPCHYGIHHPNPKSGACLVILPVTEGGRIDANKQVRFMFINGWKPGRKC